MTSFSTRYTAGFSACSGGSQTISPQALKHMRTQKGNWAVYQNQDLNSFAVEVCMFLNWGPNCANKTAPRVMPDGDWGPGWRYVYIGEVDLEKGEIVTTKRGEA